MGKQRPVLSALMAAIGLVALYRAEIRPRIYTWGAEDGEVAAQLPGDELVSEHARRIVLMSPRDYERVQRGEKASGAWGFYLRRRQRRCRW